MNKIGRQIGRAARVILTLSLVAGCVSGNTPSEKFHSRMRAKAVPPSDFLPRHELLAKQANHFPFHWFYLKQATTAYRYVCVAPVDISHLRESSAWGEFDKMLQGKLGMDMKELSEYMRKAYVQAFRKAAQEGNRLEPTDRTDLPGTLVVEPAIIAIAPTKAELNAAGQVAGFFVIGAGVVASLLSSGSIMVECRIRDAKTGEIVAMYSDTENDPTALIAPASFTWMHSARINIKELARQTALVLSAKDYREVRRKFPIQFTSLIKDADLDDDDTDKNKKK